MSHARIITIAEARPPHWAEAAVDLIFPIVCFLAVTLVCAWAWAVNRSEPWK